MRRTAPPAGLAAVGPWFVVGVFRPPQPGRAMAARGTGPSSARGVYETDALSMSSSSMPFVSGTFVSTNHSDSAAMSA